METRRKANPWRKRIRLEDALKLDIHKSMCPTWTKLLRELPLVIVRSLEVIFK